MVDVDGATVLRHVNEVTVDHVSAQHQASDKLPLQAHIDVHRGRIGDFDREYCRGRLFTDLDLLHGRIGVHRLSASPALIPARTAIKSAPVKSVGELRKSSDVPGGTPEMPGIGFATELPAKFCRPSPGGPRATRSASMLPVKPCGR